MRLPRAKHRNARKALGQLQGAIKRGASAQSAFGQ
jgi:hypothetical protein